VSTQLLTPAQAAERIGVKSTNTIYRLIAEGALRAVDIKVPPAKRSKTRIREDDLEAFIEANTREPRAS